jgi:hypothetical protein
MKFVRSEVRHICFKRKSGFTLDSELANEVYRIVDPVLKKNNWKWAEFSTVWDLSVKPNSIVPIKAIKDLNFVLEVAAKAQLLVELKMTKEWSDDELAVIHFIESQFLEGKMSWANFRKDWDVRWDHEYNKITAAMIRPPGQVQLTKEEVDLRLFERLQAEKELPAHSPTIIHIGEPKKKATKKAIE